MMVPPIRNSNWRHHLQYMRIFGYFDLKEILWQEYDLGSIVIHLGHGGTEGSPDEGGGADDVLTADQEDVVARHLLGYADG